MNLFEDNIKALAPLADRMRPTTLDEFIGQEHLVGPNTFLVRAIKANSFGSCIFWHIYHGYILIFVASFIIGISDFITT